MKKEISNLIKEEVNLLLKKLQINASCNITHQEGFWQVDISTEESGLLIGYHGNTLNSFQLILNTLVFRKLGEKEKIIVNVGDWRQKREEALKNIAQQYAQQVVLTHEPITLPYFPAAERRIIHLALQDNPDVNSESTGEGKERRITIKPKK